MFKNAVLTFQRHLPLAEQPDLLPVWDLLYERSVGCIGILKEWLDRALIAALKEGCVTLACQHLEATALSPSQCEKIAVEAHEGEAQLLPADQVRPRLRGLLGLSASAGALSGMPPSSSKKTRPSRPAQAQARPDRSGFELIEECLPWSMTCGTWRRRRCLLAAACILYRRWASVPVRSKV